MNALDNNKNQFKLLESNKMSKCVYDYMFDLVEYNSKLNAKYRNLEEKGRTDDVLEHCYHSKMWLTKKGKIFDLSKYSGILGFD